MFIFILSAIVHVNRSRRTKAGVVLIIFISFFRDILRSNRLVIDGKKVFHPRERPTLRADAVPTIFPNLPSYLTKQLPKERK